MHAGNADLRFDFVYRPTVRPLADLRLGRSSDSGPKCLSAESESYQERSRGGPVDAGQTFRGLLVRISKPFCQLATSTISNDGDTSDVGSRLTVRGAAM